MVKHIQENQLNQTISKQKDLENICEMKSFDDVVEKSQKIFSSFAPTLNESIGKSNDQESDNNSDES